MSRQLLNERSEIFEDNFSQFRAKKHTILAKILTRPRGRHITSCMSSFSWRMLVFSIRSSQVLESKMKHYSSPSVIWLRIAINLRCIKYIT